MKQSQELQSLVQLYTGRHSDLPREVVSDQQLIETLVDEMRAMAEKDIIGPGQPVIIMRPNPRFPWILVALLAAVVGFLTAALLVQTRPETDSKQTALSSAYEIRILDPQKTRVEISTGAVYSIRDQLLPLLAREFDVDPGQIEQLIFSGEHIAIRNQDLRELSSLSRLTLENCRVDLDSVSLSSLQYIQLSNCSRLDRIDVTSSRNLQMLWVKACPELTKIDGLRACRGLTRMQIEHCPKLREIEGLDSLINLTFLELTDCGHQPIQNVASLVNLEIFFFHSDLPTTFEPFSKLKSLRRFSMIGKQLKNMEGIQSLTSLTDLLICNCFDTDWSHLEGMEINLYLSDLSKGQLSNLPIDHDRLYTESEFWAQERTPWSE